MTILAIQIPFLINFMLNVMFTAHVVKIANFMFQHDHTKVK